MASSSSSSSSSSFSSYFLLLCLSMFLAVSSLGKAMPFSYNGYVVDESDYDNPQSPAPESGNSDDYVYEYDDNYVQSPASEYCPAVIRHISECDEYLNGHEDSPSPACCSNLDGLCDIGIDVGFKNMCECMKDLQASFHQSRAEDGIFKKCGYNISFVPISQQECCEY